VPDDPTPQTWHHGLVAEWWASMNVDAPEVELYRPYLARGAPVLDAGCGTGRLLVPLLREGFDVDGCDVSVDMIARCRERARGEGFDPTLWVAPLHALDAPRRYAAIVVCGAFGLGSTRAQDERAINVLFETLEEGGALVLDNEVPYSSVRRWSWWAERPELPRPWSSEPDRGRSADGGELSLWSRTVDVDPLDQSLRLELRIEKSRDGVVVAREQHDLTMRMWFRDELVMAMRHAGFRSIDVVPGAEERILAYVARK
jgi:SAM-dependent methyltransferase